jgi:polysaccharide biosynthesis protein PelB
MSLPDINTKIKTKTNKPRIVLVNRRTLFTLAAVTLTLLWVLQPNKMLLIRMMDNAQDPNIAIAFLKVLKDDTSPSLKLDLALAKQYAKLGNYQQALTEIHSIQRYIGSDLETRAKLVYTDSLLQLNYNGSDSAKQRLMALLELEVSNQSSKYDERFTNYALQIGQPKLAYQLLSQQALTNHKRLAELALQANLGSQAIQHLTADFQQQPSPDKFVAILSLLLAEQAWLKGSQFIEQQVDTVDCQLDCLQALVNFMLSANLPHKALIYAERKAQLSHNHKAWLQVSQLYAANGDTKSAAYWLAKVVALNPDIEHLQQLHDYQLWLGNSAKALEMTKRMLQKGADVAILQQGISEAIAQSDLHAISDFYYALAMQNQLATRFQNQWLDFNDKAYGAELTIGRLEALHHLYPEQRFYWFALARFYNFVGAQHKTIQLWQHIQPKDTLNYQQANYFAQAYIALGQPEQALALLNKHTELLSLDLNQLSNLQSLAMYVADSKTQRLIQQLRIDRKDPALDPYLLISSYNIHAPKDLHLLWQYYQYSGSVVILSHILNYAISTKQTDLIDTVTLTLKQNLAQEQGLQVQLLRLRIAIYRGNNNLAKQLLLNLAAAYPDNQEINENSLWLAISSNDTDWLAQLYWQLAPKLQSDSSFFQPLAYAAQTLGLQQQANLWYQRLDNSDYASAANKLAWALLLEQQGNESQAQSLRWQVLIKLSEQLKQLPQGELSYHALLRLFVSAAYANTQQDLALQLAIDSQDTTNLFFAVDGKSLQKLAYWQAHSLLASSKFNTSIQLAIALAYDDFGAISALATGSNYLTLFERATAFSKIGQNFTAWQLAEQALNPSIAKQQLAPLQRYLANSHNLNSHGVRFEHISRDSWRINTEHFSYYQPLSDGLFSLDYQSEYDSSVSSIVNDYQRDLLQLNWQTRNWVPFTAVDLSLAIGRRYQQTIFGQQLSLTWQSSPRISQQLEFRHKMPSEQSENLYLLGHENRLQWRGAWQAARYEQISLTLAAAEFNTDFSDKVGQHLQASLRISEQVSFHPNWQFYSQFDYHKNFLASQPLAAVSAYFNTNTALHASTLINSEFQRFTLGQQIIHGNIGVPGPDEKPPRYSLGTAIGYNLLTSKLDYSANFSMGIPMLGSDEMFFKAAWQSADQNGQKNLSWNLGYFIDF